jgi:hypothetical protein
VITQNVSASLSLPAKNLIKPIALAEAFVSHTSSLRPEGKSILRLHRRQLLLPHLPRVPLLLRLQLVRPPDRDILGPVIAKRPLERLLDDEAPDVIQDHDGRHREPEGVGELDEAELRVELGDELGRAGESHAGDEDDAPVHAAVFADAFAEGPALVVDGEGRDLLDELQQVDGAVQERGLEVAFEVDIGFSGFDPLHVVRDIHKCDDVNRKLTQYGSDDVEVENVGLRPLFRQALDRLASS